MLREIDEFISIHIYPAANKYQETICNRYIKWLHEDEVSSFVPITFEKFIETGKSVFQNEREYTMWIDYLEARYIVIPI